MSTVETLKRFEERRTAHGLSALIHQISRHLPGIKLMHVCGTHEHEIVMHGLRQLIPENVQIIAGPGCPVCICPIELIDRAIAISYLQGVTVLTFGDMLRVPASRESLDDTRKNGGSVKMIYSPFDAIQIAEKHPDEKYVFFSAGFETTVAGVAGLIRSGVPENLTFLMANRYIPAIFQQLMVIHDPDSIRGFILPGHAAAVTGKDVYDFIQVEYRHPGVIAGFTAIDILQAIYDLIRMISEGSASVLNNYTRVVRNQGNPNLLKVMNDTFDMVAGNWRGIGIVEGSAFRIKEKFCHLDAALIFTDINLPAARPDPPDCLCPQVIMGEQSPEQCPMFKRSCSPESPIGPCMVSQEGTCFNWYHG